MKMTPERMAEIEAAEAAATGGPWEVEGLYPVCAPEVRDDEDQAAIVAHTDGNSWLGSDEAEKNAAFIAMSRTAIPELLAAIEELEGEAAVMDKHLALAAREIMDRNGKIDALRERINMTMPDMGKRDAEIVARAETAESDLADARAVIGRVREVDRYGAFVRPQPCYPKMVKRVDGEWIKVSDLDALLPAPATGKAGE